MKTLQLKYSTCSIRFAWIEKEWIKKSTENPDDTDDSDVTITDTRGQTQVRLEFVWFDLT